MGGHQRPFDGQCTADFVIFEVRRTDRQRDAGRRECLEGAFGVARSVDAVRWRVRVPEISEHRPQDFAERVRFAQRDVDPADADLDSRSDLQQLDANRVDLGGGQGGSLGSELFEGFVEDIGDGGEHQSQLVRAHRMGTRPIGEQKQLLFLDPVLHVSATAVAHFLKGLSRHLLGSQVGHDEPGIGPFPQVLGFADDTP